MHRPTMAAAVVPRPPWCPTPGSSYHLCSCSLLCLIVACIRDGFECALSLPSTHQERSVRSSSSLSPSSPSSRSSRLRCPLHQERQPLPPPPPPSLLSSLRHPCGQWPSTVSSSSLPFPSPSPSRSSRSSPRWRRHRPRRMVVKTKRVAKKTDLTKNKKYIRRSLNNLFANVRVGMVNLLSGQRNHSLKGE